MRVTVYSKAKCQGCKLTGMKLDKMSIPFEYVRIDLDDEAKAKAEAYGYMSVPIVVVDLGDGAEWTWYGYAPSKIEELHKLLNGGDPEVAAA